MAAIQFTGRPDTMGGTIADAPAFPGERFSVTIPEAIGDAARTTWQGLIKPHWENPVDGTWRSLAKVEGELSYVAEVTTTEETVDIAITLTNESDRTWDRSCAFTCFQCGGAPSIRDHDCVRHWVGHEGQPRRLAELPRHYGPRPTIQLYSVAGAPPGAEIPFVNNFHATPDVVLDGWMAIRSRDGKRLAAVASSPALFLFQNMEYSCIHACPGFGRLEPGQSGVGRTRLYFVEASLEAWHERLSHELQNGLT